MADGFLGRWSRRKLDVKAGEPENSEVVIPAKAGTQGALDPRLRGDDGGGGDAAGGGDGEVKPAPPTLEDTHSLTPESDFKPFMNAGVSPEVKNAAMKKLFTDPHFNVMDGLDTYIDDYSKPDPIPYAMLRQLASAKFLGLFDEEEKQEAKEAARKARDVADNPTSQSVAKSEADADPDLRLQPDDAAPGKDPGRGAQ
ncbi:MAG: DUF3306 domain-containing protein [Burkholderiales bacterium]|nr:DUF3306 domain-containing protein [Burkholderiales bacterium]